MKQNIECFSFENKGYVSLSKQTQSRIYSHIIKTKISRKSFYHTIHDNFILKKNITINKVDSFCIEDLIECFKENIHKTFYS